MNPNKYNQAIYPFNFYIPPISSLQNPTTNDFERLIERYQQYFFFIINQQRHYPRAQTSKIYIKSIATFSPSHYNMWEKVTTVVLITTYTFCVLFIVCVLLEKILTVIRDKL